MAKRWIVVIVVAIAVMLVSSAIGSFVPNLTSFAENLFAELFGLCAALALAIWLIEGRIQTWENRRQATIVKDAKSILRMSRQYSSLLVTDLANLLSYELKLDLNVYQVKARSIDQFNEMAMVIFEQARRVPDNGLPSNSDFGEDVFGRCVESIEKFSHNVHEFYRGNYDVQTYLSGLTDVVEDLDRQITASLIFPEATDEASRFKATGEIGRVLLEFEKRIADDYSAIQ